MMFRTAYIRILLVLIPFAGTTQSLKKANELFETRSYVKAIEIYKKLPPTRESLMNLGDCYYYNLDVRNAAKIYDTVYETYDETFPEGFYFRYADALKGIKQYYKADLIASTYLGISINTEEFRELLQEVVPYTYEVERLNTFSQTVSFGPFVHNGELIFASPASNASKKYKWNDQPYLDLYKGTLSEENTLDSIIPYSNALNSKTHEASVAITKNGRTIYFSRTDPERNQIEDVKVATVKIYRAQWANGDWGKAEPLAFSSDSYSVQHPALSPDEDRLYFASDMPVSEGSFDIYYVDLKPDGSTGEPVNLGPSINTKHREQFPFIDTDGTLYFSSNGHPGFGGLDIYLSRFESDSFLSPLNLGEEMNSSRDDFGYTSGRSEEEGFLSSNRLDIDQIYRFTRVSKDREYMIRGLVTDANTQEILPETQVTLYDDKGNALATVITDELGRYELSTEPNKTYQLEAQKPLYIGTSELFSTSDSGDLTFNIELKLESYDDAEDIVIQKEDGFTYIELENIYFDLDRWEIKPQAAQTLDILIDLLRKYPKMEIELGAHTDSRASPEYNMNLSQKRADAAMEYIISKGISEGRIVAKGFGETRPLVDCGRNCTEIQFSINRRCEFIIIR
jgi:peptidoglycan-associated lipoprotein